MRPTASRTLSARSSRQAPTISMLFMQRGRPRDARPEEASLPRKIRLTTPSSAARWCLTRATKPTRPRSPNKLRASIVGGTTISASAKATRPANSGRIGFSETPRHTCWSARPRVLSNQVREAGADRSDTETQDREEKYGWCTGQATCIAAWNRGVYCSLTSRLNSVENICATRAPGPPRTGCPTRAQRPRNAGP